jgi:hypothetical protein
MTAAEQGALHVSSARRQRVLVLMGGRLRNTPVTGAAFHHSTPRRVPVELIRDAVVLLLILPGK